MNPTKPCTTVYIESLGCAKNQVDSEVMLVRGGDGTVALSVDRGVYGTTAAAHSSGATIADVTVTVS